VKKTCGVWAFIFVVCAAVMGFLAWRRIDVAAVPAALAGGGVLWVGLAYLAGITEKMARARKINRALSGETPRDGEIIAAIGRIVPLGDTLYSPFQRVPCVAYKYRARVQGNKTMRTDFDGYALTPSMIDGPHGAVKLLAWPELDVPETYCNTPELRQNALDYVAKTPFTIPQMMRPDLTTSPGVRFDHQHATPDATLQRASLYEAVLRPGQEVCALGYYSATEGGLTHEPAEVVPTLMIMNGDAAAIKNRLVRRSIGNFLGGIIFIAIAAIGMLMLYINVPLEAAEQMSPNRGTWWWEVRLEQLIHRVKPRDPNAWTPTNFSAGRANGRIVVRDHEEHPQSATATREGDLVTVTFDKGVASAVIDTTTKKLTHFELLGTTYTDGAELELLGEDKRSIEGRITYLGTDARCRIAFNAALNGESSDDERR